MDEITKVILGMLAAFITAFLAEPLKKLITDLLKIERIRLGLYKELIGNYGYISGVYYDGSIKDINSLIQYKMLIQTTYYEYVIANEIELFYKMRESTLINNLFRQTMFLQGDVRKKIREAIEDESFTTGNYFEANKMMSDSMIKTFTTAFEVYVANKKLERKYVERVISKESMSKILERAKKSKEVIKTIT